MKQFKGLTRKEKAEYITNIALYPLFLLFNWLVGKIKFLKTGKRKIAASVLSFVMVLTMIPMVPLTAYAAETSGTLGDSITWELDDSGTLTISGSGGMWDYDSGNYSPGNCSPFYNNANVKTVIIQDGIKNIGSFLFYNCTGLTSITIPNSVTTIGEGAFLNCKSLPSVTLPNGLKMICDYTFSGCTGLTSITIPSGVTSIGYQSFYECASLSSVTLPDSIETIGNGAFFSCIKLASLTIPYGVTSIGSGAFRWTRLTSITIPDSVTSLGPVTFADCVKLSSITLPNGLTKIEDKTFAGCSSLASVTIPDGVIEIGWGAFASCTGLTSITLPNSVTTINNAAFYECTSLTEVTFCGTPEQWDKITGDGKRDLTNKVTYDCLGNHSGGTATCQAKAVCEICGKEYGELADHNYSIEWNKNETSHWHECTVCGVHEQDFGHSGGTATCQEKAKCVDCGAEYDNLANHDFDTTYTNDETGHWYGCKTTGCTEISDFEAHTPNIEEATETEDKVCTKCGYVMEAKLGHIHRLHLSFVSAADSTCTTQGNKPYYECECGAYFEDETGTREITDKTSVLKPLEAHKGGTATCTDKAVCSVCGVQYGEADASNHKNTEVRDAKSATCCEAGYTGDTWCTDCNTKIASGEEIPATGSHVDVDGEWEFDGTNHYHTCYFGTKFDITAHSGNEATCKDKVVCFVCGATYGEVNAFNHKGTTYIKDQKEATCYEEGYTGDTYCSDCGRKIKDGTVIEKNAHNPASVWSTDENYHWKDCQTVGCGNLVDKALHSGGEATCVDKAVCAVCGVQYGDVDASNHKHTEIRDAKAATCCEAGYTGDRWCTDCNTKIASGEAIPATGEHVDVDGEWETDENNHWHTCYFGTKFDETAHNGGEATCKDNAICSDCGTAYGEVDASNHKGTTYLKDQKEATCYEEGYTGDTYCSDCDAKIKDGTVIEKDAHNPASVWSTDETDHWKECQTVGCGNIIDKAPHSGGEATCVDKAVCAVCGVQYGDVDASNHKNTEVRDAKDAACSEAGYTGDTWCTDCNKKVAEGKDIEALEHNPVLVKAEDATAAKEGNITHYYCENCGNYYSDEAGTKEITKEDTVVSKLAPKIIDGNNAKIDKSSKEPLSFRSDAAFADFIRVELDGKELVKDKDYTLKEGSIIASLTPEFVATLSVGEHTLGIVSVSGMALAKFTVMAGNTSSSNSAGNTSSSNSTGNTSSKSPQTGDNSNMIFWSLISVISLSAFCTTAMASKKKKQSR